MDTRYDDADDLQPNATCDDCGIDFSRALDDVGPYCDSCSDRRDAWVAALELRMAKTMLPARTAIA
jgi:hypothetical protein